VQAWLEREILEQPEHVSALLHAYADLRPDSPERLAALAAELPPRLQSLRTGEFGGAAAFDGELHWLGCGSAGYAAALGARFAERIAGVRARASLASGLLECEPPFAARDCVIAVSQSGESSDTLRAASYARQRGCALLAITSRSESTLARSADAHLDTHAGEERAIPSTKGFTAQVLVSWLLAATLAELRGERIDLGPLIRLPEALEAVIERSRKLEERAHELGRARQVFFLGDGDRSVVAREGALKLCETARVPSCALPSGEIRHGPLALVDAQTPVVVLSGGHDLREDTRRLERLLEQLEACGAPLWILHPEGRPLSSAPSATRIALPDPSPRLPPVIDAVALQLLAFYAGRALGFDVDRPRNLSKSVRVE